MNDKKLKLLCVLAHPDDESLGMGGTLARCAAEGIETYLVTATRGERGWFGDEKENPGLTVLGQMREKELLGAAEALGIREVHFLDYIDGDLDQAPHDEAVAKIVSHIRRVKPDIVISFAPDGAYGHPDHIAICQFTTAAVVCAADPNYGEGLSAAHRVSKLYYMAWPKGKWDAYQAAFGDLVMHVDGVDRRAIPWPDWAVTTVINTTEYWSTVWKAVSCHKTQLVAYGQLEHLPDDLHEGLWGSQEFYRVFSTVNGGRALETDLFEGLR
ncbi:MAG TPA: PIG-L deacetylase family protein [Anaerolineales bacterium]|nr:PIG-L deacetylase family protein [Anaerolineales bacterium]